MEDSMQGFPACTQMVLAPKIVALLPLVTGWGGDPNHIYIYINIYMYNTHVHYIYIYNIYTRISIQLNTSSRPMGAPVITMGPMDSVYGLQASSVASALMSMRRLKAEEAREASKR